MVVEVSIERNRVFIEKSTYSMELILLPFTIVGRLVDVIVQNSKSMHKAILEVPFEESTIGI
jgi:hypothetical protein